VAEAVGAGMAGVIPSPGFAGLNALTWPANIRVFHVKYSNRQSYRTRGELTSPAKKVLDYGFNVARFHVRGTVLYSLFAIRRSFDGND
jgi:hypothetical protein